MYKSLPYDFLCILGTCTHLAASEEAKLILSPNYPNNYDR